MRDWTIGRRIATGFGLVLLVVLGLGVFSELQRTSIAVEAQAIGIDSVPGLYLSGQLESLARGNYALTLEHVYTRSPQEKGRLEGEMAKLVTRIGQVAADYEKTIVTPEDRALYDTMVARRAEFLRLREAQVLAPSRNRETKKAVAALNQTVRPAFDQFMNACQALVDVNNEGAVSSSTEIRSLLDRSRVSLAIGFLLIALGGSAVGFVITRGSTRVLQAAATDLAQGAQQVASAAQQVASASQSLSQGATEQAASLEETSASMEEMASMTRQNAENSRSRPPTLMAEVDAARARVERRRWPTWSTSMAAIEESSAQGLQDHQDDRRDRVPDQHPRAERGRRGGARRRGRHGLRGRGRRGAQPGAALGAGGARTRPALIEESIAKVRRGHDEGGPGGRRDRRRSPTTRDAGQEASSTKSASPAGSRRRASSRSRRRSPRWRR